MKFFTDYFSGYRKPGGLRELLLLAIPMVISTACDAVMTFTDRLFLARLGPEEMNAAMSGFVMFQVLTFFVIGLTAYSTALVAQYHGAHEPQKAARAGFQAVLVTLAAWPIVILLGPLANAISVRSGLSPAQIEWQTLYLDILVRFAILSMMRYTLGCYFSGIGRTRIVMVATLVAMVVNVVLDYLLIFGRAGFPAMGVQGAAWATLLGALSAILILAVALLIHLRKEGLSPRAVVRFDAIIMRKLLYYGTPAGLELLLNFIAFSAMVLMYHARGSAEATAVTIMFNWDMVSFIPLLGVQVAVTSLVGRYMGARRPETAHRAALSGIRGGLFYSVVIMVLFLVFPRTLVMVFAPVEVSDIFNQAVPIAVRMIQLASLYVLADAVMIAVSGALRGAGDTRFTMVVSVLAHWSLLPVLYLLLHVLHVPVAVSWMAVILMFMLFCMMISIRFERGAWKKIRIIH